METAFEDGGNSIGQDRGWPGIRGYVVLTEDECIKLPLLPNGHKTCEFLCKKWVARCLRLNSRNKLLGKIRNEGTNLFVCERVGGKHGDVLFAWQICRGLCCWKVHS